MIPRRGVVTTREHVKFTANKGTSSQSSRRGVSKGKKRKLPSLGIDSRDRVEPEYDFRDTGFVRTLRGESSEAEATRFSPTSTS